MLIYKYHWNLNAKSYLVESICDLKESSHTKQNPYKKKTKHKAAPKQSYTTSYH